MISSKLVKKQSKIIMLKSLSSALIICLISGLALAQKTNNIKFGVKTSVSMSKFKMDNATAKKFINKDFFDYIIQNNFNDNYSVNALPSVNFGAQVDYVVKNKLSIQTGLSLNKRGIKLVFEDGKENLTETYSITYLEVPANLVYQNNGVYFGAGPYFSFALSGKQTSKYWQRSIMKETSKESERDLAFGKNATSDFNTNDFGVNFQTGYEFKIGINLGLSYSLGLSNIHPEPKGGEFIKNSAAAFSLGYSF